MKLQTQSANIRSQTNWNDIVSSLSTAATNIVTAIKTPRQALSADYTPGSVRTETSMFWMIAIIGVLIYVLMRK